MNELYIFGKNDAKVWFCYWLNHKIKNKTKKLYEEKIERVKDIKEEQNSQTLKQINQNKSWFSYITMDIQSTSTHTHTQYLYEIKK